MSDTNADYIGILLEEIRDQNKTVLEAVGDIQRNTADLPQIRADVAELKSHMKIVKAATTHISKQQNEHERRIRITQLEAA